MTYRHSNGRLGRWLLTGLIAMSMPGLAAQSADNGGLTLEPARQVSFETTEGTWLSLDVSPDGSRIVFELLGDLYLMPFEGGDASPLTRGMAFDSQPRFSPDGERVVFVSDRDGSEDLWTIAIAGGEAEQLTRETGNVEFASPEYAPDGSHVIVSRTSWPLRVFELWAYHLDGGKGVRITRANKDLPRSQRINSLGGVYSADGRYLYFSRKSGGFGYNIGLPQWQIVRRDLVTGDEDTLTQAQGSAFRPRLSPDGTALVYGTRYEHETGLRIRNLETGEDRWLVYPVERDDQESRFTRDLLPGYAFTPDGSELVYTAGGGIRSVALADGEIHDIPFQARVDQGLGPRLYFPYRIGLGPVKARMLMGPALSPDGTKLAFSSFLTVYVYDLETGELRALTPTDRDARGARGFHPAWSPDGRDIVYVSWSSRGGHLWRVRADGRGSPRRLSEVPAYYTDPVFTPDGSRIVVLRAASYDRLYREFDFGSPVGSDLVWFPREGGRANLIRPSRGFQRPHFGPDGDRIFVYHSTTGLVSFRFDGSDRRDHLEVKGPGIYLDEDAAAAADVRLSPDGRHALALHANQLYLVRLINPHLGDLTVDLDRPVLPLARLTDVGADFFGWAAGGDLVFWTVGSQLYTRPLASVTFDAGEGDNGSDAGGEETASDPGAAPDPEPDQKTAEARTETEDSEADEPVLAEEQTGVQSYPVDVYRPRHRPVGVLALVGATVLTMEEGSEPIIDATVVIGDDRILAVGRDYEVDVPAEATVIDATGTWILPGFIDTHAHFRPLRRVLDDENWAFLANLAYGVTTGLDVQPSTTDILAYQDLIDAGLMLGPRALSTGPGLFSNNAFRSAAHAEAVLRRYKSHYGVRNLKSYLVGNRAQRQYVVQAANALRLMPTAEGGLDMKLDLTHVIDGFAGNEHNFPLLNLYRDTVELVARSGIAYTPTLLVTFGGPFAENWFYTRESPHRDPKLRRFLPPEVIASRTLRGPWFHDDEHVFARVAAQAAKIVRAGGRVGVGSHGQLQGLGYHWEMRALAAGGLSPMEVLTAATRHGAGMIGVEADLGTVSAGKLADLVVLDANPMLDLRNSTKIRYVVKNGELYDARTLDQLWPDQRPLPELWWWGQEPAPAPVTEP